MDARATDCLFCRIAREEVPAEVVHASDAVMAFRDINPQAPTHLLIISRDHITSAAELDDSHAALLAEIAATAAHLARAEGIDRTGWRLVTNVGPEAGQSVPHLHFHLLGGRSMGWPPG